MMLTTSTLSLFSPDKREELQHDLSFAAPSIEDWKLHVLRSIHQDAAKSEIVDSLKPSQVLLIMDCAMKFIPTSFCETQRDWFGKKGGHGLCCANRLQNWIIDKNAKSRKDAKA